MQYDLTSPQLCCHPFCNCKCPGAGPCMGKHFTELQLYLEVNKDQLDVANTKNLQLESEVNQLTSELNTVSQSLTLALARPAVSSSLGAAPQASKLSKIFTDPRTYDSSRGKKFEEWWTHIHIWQDENSATLAGAAGICAMLSRMVGGDASTFAHAQLNKMIGGKKTWTEFTTLVEGNFWSTNKKDWNRKALSSLKQGSTPMNTFITRFNMFQALAKYPEDQLIKLLEQNADWQIIKRLILEKGHYTLVAEFKKDLKQAESRKQLLNFIKSGMAEWAKTRDLNAMDINATQSSNNKCFNCSGDHFIKECKKPMLQCSDCKFLGRGHKKDCSCCSKGGKQVHSAKKEEEGTLTRHTSGSNIMKTSPQRWEKPKFKASIWVC